MSINLEKVMRIISDLIAYCHDKGGEEYQIFLKRDGDGSSVTISSAMPGILQEDLNALLEELNIPRQREIEQSYWELSGELEMESELSLVGMMIDEAAVGYREGVLHIHVLRKD